MANPPPIVSVSSLLLRRRYFCQTFIFSACVKYTSMMLPPLTSPMSAFRRQHCAFQYIYIFSEYVNNAKRTIYTDRIEIYTHK